MTRDELHDTFTDQGKLGTLWIGDMWIADNTYRQLSEPFIADAFSTALRAWLVTFNNETWQSESWDCDDYAMEATMLMRRLHKATPGSKGTAPAFGFIWYESGTRGLHAINFAICGKRKVVYYEPQLQRIVQLTDAEKQSIEFVYV